MHVFDHLLVLFACACVRLTVYLAVKYEYAVSVG